MSEYHYTKYRGYRPTCYRVCCKKVAHKKEYATGMSRYEYLAKREALLAIVAIFGIFVVGLCVLRLVGGI